MDRAKAPAYLYQLVQNRHSKDDDFLDSPSGFLLFAQVISLLVKGGSDLLGRRL